MSNLNAALKKRKRTKEQPVQEAGRVNNMYLMCFTCFMYYMYNTYFLVGTYKSCLQYPFLFAILDSVCTFESISFTELKACLGVSGWLNTY